jgi:hypothetical protein
MNTSSFVEGSVVKGRDYALTLFLSLPQTYLIKFCFVLRLLQCDAPVQAEMCLERDKARCTLCTGPRVSEHKFSEARRR